MKIDLALMAGNPLSTSYLTFFATIKSWVNYVDTILWLDSGTNDGSIKQFSEDERGKIRVISDFRTNWDINDDFSPNAINSMINAGIQETDADWLIIIGADFVLNKMNRSFLERELSTYEDELWVKFARKKIKLKHNLTFSEKWDSRGTVCLNMRKAKELSYFPYLYGIDNNSRFLSDYPLNITHYGSLKKADGVEVVPFGDFSGSEAPLLKSLNVFVADHFFYKAGQAVLQRMRFQKYFNSLANGSAPYRRLEARCIVGFEKSRWNKQELMTLPYPSEFKAIINKFYSNDMLGGVVFKENLLVKLTFKICRIERKFRDLLFSYDSCLDKMKKSEQIEEAISAACDLKSILDER